MPHNESQMIHPNQQLSGSALSLFRVLVQAEAAYVDRAAQW
jgi:hypothetical protein